MLLLLDVEEVSCSGSIACALFELKQQSGRVITLWCGIGGKQLLVTFTLNALQTTETSHSCKTLRGDTLYLQPQTPHLHETQVQDTNTMVSSLSPALGTNLSPAFSQLSERRTFLELTFQKALSPVT